MDNTLNEKIRNLNIILSDKQYFGELVKKVYTRKKQEYDFLFFKNEKDSCLDFYYVFGLERIIEMFLEQDKYYVITNIEQTKQEFSCLLSDFFDYGFLPIFYHSFNLSRLTDDFLICSTYLSECGLLFYFMKKNENYKNGNIYQYFIPYCLDFRHGYNYFEELKSFVGEWGTVFYYNIAENFKTLLKEIIAEILDIIWFKKIELD